MIRQYIPSQEREANDTMAMKEQIERALQALRAEPLSDMFRFAGIQAFEFGVQRPGKNRKGQDITLADQRLHVSCDWRLDGTEGVIVSSEDFGLNGSRHDELAHPFYAMLKNYPPVVEVVVAEESGALRLLLSGGYTLNVLPDELSDDSDEEQWRFLPKDKEQGHLVLTRQGIEP